MMARSGLGRTHGRTGARGKSGRTPTPWGIEFFGRPEHNRFWLTVGFLLRHRAELTTLVVGCWLFVVTEQHIAPVLPAGLTPAQGTGILFAATVTVAMAVPITRRYLWRRCWAIMTRHRMRTCFYQTRTWTTNGRMPFLLWSRPSPVGERVRVWLPAGLSVNHLERIDDELAAACWAREARITVLRRQAALAVVDIIRHDPLGTSRPLTPPVVDHLDPNPGSDVDAASAAATATGRPIWLVKSDPPPPPAPSTPGAPAASAGTQRTSTTPGAKSAGSGASAEPPVTGFGGEDVSDYI